MRVMLYKTDLLVETLIKTLEELDPTIQNRIQWSMFIGDLKRQLIRREEEDMDSSKLRWTLDFVLQFAKHSRYIVGPINARGGALCHESTSFIYSIFLHTKKIIADSWFSRYTIIEEKIRADMKEKIRIQEEREKFCSSCSCARYNSKGELSYTDPCQKCYHNIMLTENYMAR